MKLARLRDKMSRHAPNRFARWKRRRLQYADKKLEERMHVVGLLPQKSPQELEKAIRAITIPPGIMAAQEPKLSLWQRFLAWFRRWAER